MWLAAAISIGLPIIGVGAALYGAFRMFGGAPLGWAWLLGGVGVLIADLVIDHRWSRWTTPGGAALNRRGEQLVGEVVTVVDPIEAGARGSVRVGDSLWVAEGAVAARGAQVCVAGCKGSVLTVEPI